MFRSSDGVQGPRFVVPTLAFVCINVSFMQTLVIPIQAELPGLFDADRSDTAWVITATLLAASVITPISGRLGDMYGKRRVALVLLGLLLLGSVVGALATTLVPLIVGRALQGAALGLIPLSISILREILHADRLRGSIALVSATLAGGGAIGLTLSAFVSEVWDWHVLFWFAAAVAVLNLVLVLVFVPSSAIRTLGRFDFIGAVGLAGGLTGVLLAVTRGNDWGWASALTLCCGTGGIGLLVAWGWWELRTVEPLVNLRLAAKPQALFTNLASIAMGFALFASNIAFPQLLTIPESSGVGLGLSLTVASLILMPAGLVTMGIAPVFGRLSRVVGARGLLIAGSIAIFGSYTIALLAPVEVATVFLVNAVLGVGIGLGYSALPILILEVVPPEETAAANSLNSLMRSLGTTLGAASIGGVLAQLATGAAGAQVPTMTGFDVAFILGMAAAALCGLLAVLIPRGGPSLRSSPAVSPEPT